MSASANTSADALPARSRWTRFAFRAAAVITERPVADEPVIDTMSVPGPSTSA